MRKTNIKVPGISNGRPAHEDNLELNPSDIQNARQYIADFWINLERFHPNDEDTLLGLPKPYLVPAHNPTTSFNFEEMYYWDSYFMIQGLLRSVDYKELVMGVLENLFSLFKRFRIIPNASRTYLMGRSQPPLLTSFIFDAYEAYGLDRRWLEQAMSYAHEEYETVWMGTQKPHWRLVHDGLSRYYDINMLHDLAEAESGWDMTPRFDRRCLDFLPVDLNAFLYKYEMDFARAADLLDRVEAKEQWLARAEQRRKTMTDLMWDKKTGLFYDYDFKNNRRGKVASLASYTTLWTGLATDDQAKSMVKSMTRFECLGGWATTSSQLLTIKKTTPQQWAYPNGWAPLHFFLAGGLSRYGYKSEAKRVAHTWLSTNLRWFNQHGVFLEKYNVVTLDKLPEEGLYPTQIGFGWSNAIFERFCQDYFDRGKDVDE